MPLTLHEAQTVITGAHECAAKLSALVTAAVVDEGGHLQALGRMNGAAPISAQIAETKAASVVLFRRDGAALRQLQEANPGFFAQLDRAVRVPILAGAGAALIMRGDTVLGALAVSGGMMPGQDDECAEAGLTVLAPWRSPSQVPDHLAAGHQVPELGPIDLGEGGLAATSPGSPAGRDGRGNLAETVEPGSVRWDEFELPLKC